MATNECTALVLSAGGMFGAWQAGVWDALCDIFDPDVVVGASVGSLNGWMVACGCGGSELTKSWLDAGKLAGIHWRWPRRFSEGLLDGSALECWVQQNCDGRLPRRRYGVVLTHTRTLRPTLFQWPSVNWTHIAGSCGVPLFLRQQVIDGHMYSDGGFIDPLPLGAALQMGATRIVTVNVMKHRPWMLERVVHLIQSATDYQRPNLGEVRIVDVSPSTRVGDVRASMYWSHDNTCRWIDEGRQAGLRNREAVLHLIGAACDHDWRGISDSQTEGVSSYTVPVGSSHSGDVPDQAQRL